jgi:hypothetical protein
MLGNYILGSGLLFLILAKFVLASKSYYKKLSFIIFVIINSFTVFLYVVQYYYLHYDFGVAEPDMSITIIPRLFLELCSVFFLNIIYNILYVILNCRIR